MPRIRIAAAVAACVLVVAAPACAASRSSSTSASNSTSTTASTETSGASTALRTVPVTTGPVTTGPVTTTAVAPTGSVAAATAGATLPVVSATSAPTGVPEPSTSAAPPVYAFPIAAPARASYGRTHHDYPAADIFAACGSGVVAVTGGTVDELSTIDRWAKRINDPTTRGGLFVSLTGDDGVRYYVAHLQAVDASISVGMHVTAGQPLGLVGRTGDASACHVHLGVSPLCSTVEWWVRRGVAWPQHYLDAWRSGLNTSPGLEIYGWATTHPDACTDASSMPWPSR